MLAATMFLLLLVVSAVYYGIIRVRDRGVAVPATVSALARRPPGGIFLQDGFTWSRILPNGDVLVGAHPLLVGLAGVEPEPDPGIVKPCALIRRGEPLLRITSGDRSLSLRSPLTGRIVGYNLHPTGADDWEGATEKRGTWAVRIRPRDLPEALPSWRIGPEAKRWSESRYQALGQYLQLAGGPFLADGGELRRGALQELEPDAWRGLEEAFLRG
ncbi:MAG: hypothetical protein R6X22_12050 [Gemmatimonadota bacterium]